MAKPKRSINNYSESYHLVKQLDFARIYLNQKSSILLVQYHAKTIIDVSKAKIVIESVGPIIHQYNILFGITDARVKDLNITREARQLYSNNSTLKKNKKHAIIVNHFPIRMLANFFIKIDVPVIPSRVFNSLKSAEEWLQE